jgi:membrane protein
MKHKIKFGLIDYYFLFVLFSPAVGIFLMELGFISLEVGAGHYNGATIIYILSCAIVYIIYRAGLYTKISNKGTDGISSGEIRNYFNIILVIDLFILFLCLFILGGIKVWSGQIGKGQFRISFGALGSFAYLLYDYVVPSNILILTLIYIKCDKFEKSKNRTALFIAYFLTMLIAATWGAKSFVITILLPALFILFYESSLKLVIKIGSVGLVLIVLAAIFFEGKSFNVNLASFSKTNFVYSNSSNSSLIAVLYRLSVLQGDIPWKIWDIYATDSQAVFFDYGKTFISIIPDTILDFFGINIYDYSKYVEYHYSLQLTYLFGRAVPNNIQEVGAHNVTGTWFSEAIIAGGWCGVIIFAVLLGLLARFIRLKIDYYVRCGNITKLAISVIWCHSVLFPVISSGGVSAFFLISTTFKFGALYFYILLIKFLAEDMAKYTKK